MSREPRPCSKCPKWQDGYCPVRACLRPPDAPSCEYGRKKMNSANAAEYNRRKYGWKKRAPKPSTEEEDND